MGSSPCIQGRPANRTTNILHIRFIPVYTGQTLTEAPTKDIQKVHPRVYGADAKLPKNLCYYKIANPISNSYGRISMYHLFRMCFCG